jgi:hypothetical protein
MLVGFLPVGLVQAIFVLIALKLAYSCISGKHFRRALAKLETQARQDKEN